MPVFHITSPDGHTYEVNAPEGATEQDALARVRAEHAAPAQKAAPPAPANAQQQKLGIGDVASGALVNFPASAGRLVGNVYEAVRHPIESAKAVGHLALGAVEKVIPGEQSDERYADAFGHEMADRYGGVENIKRTIATDPAGFLADASIFTGGGGAALKATGYAGKIADAAGTVSRVANPISQGLKAVGGTSKLGGKATSAVLGVTTGAGQRSVQEAFRAGRNGGTAAEAFQSNMRGRVPIDSVVDDARNALGNLRDDRSRNYRLGMSGVAGDTTALSLDPIVSATDKAGSIDNFKGIDLSDETASVKQKVASRLDQWSQLDPAEYHTAAGLDALKRSLGKIVENTQPGTSARTYADRVYNAVKGEVVKQAPEYASVMDEYGDASRQLSDVQKTLSLGEKASTDTTVRKLQSVMRNNVSTNYGQRVELANVLAQNGATDLMPALAGQSLSSPMSRGLGQLLAGGEIGGGVATAVAGHPLAALAVVPPLLMQSPRLVGEGSYYAGKIARLAGKVSPKRSTASSAALVAEEMERQRDRQRAPINFGGAALAH